MRCTWSPSPTTPPWHAASWNAGGRCPPNRGARSFSTQSSSTTTGGGNWTRRRWWIRPPTAWPTSCVEATRRQAVWPRGVERAAARHPWAGALVAHHAATVYQRFRTAPAWKAFFDTMETARTRLVARSGFTLPALHADYAYLRHGDLASLVFCTADAEAEHAGTRFRLEGTHLTITPDPFGGESFSIAVPARVLPDRDFLSDDELRDACRHAERIEIRGRVSGGA
ncbi:MAG: DUF3891 family protein [Vicinamibacterales bacterium]